MAPDHLSAALRKALHECDVTVAALIALGLVGLGIAAVFEETEGEPTPAAETSAAPSPTPTTKEPEVTPVAEEPTAAPVVATISVDDLADKLEGNDSDVGDLFLVAGSLFLAEQWGTGATGDYFVLLSAYDGDQNLPVFVDEDMATAWTDGTEVEFVLQHVERTLAEKPSPDGSKPNRSGSSLLPRRPRRPGPFRWPLRNRSPADAHAYRDGHAEARTVRAAHPRPLRELHRRPRRRSCPRPHRRPRIRQTPRP